MDSSWYSGGASSDAPVAGGEAIGDITVVDIPVGDKTLRFRVDPPDPAKPPVFRSVPEGYVAYELWLNMVLWLSVYEVRFG